MHAVPRFLVAWFAATLLFIGGLHSGAALAVPITPTADFTDNGDGTVMHKITGLTWKRCAEGQIWAGSTCSGTATGYTWAQATALTASFAGKSDWRLPTIRELSTIAEMDAYNPAINTTIFPNTPASYFWSASGYAYNLTHVWGVNFGYGYGSTYYNVGGVYVRLVRGGQSVGLLALNRPTMDYLDNGDGTVTHTPTALTWKRCAEGQTWSDSTCSGTADTSTWAAATALTSTFAGKSDWRLPTQVELRSLVDFTLAKPSINTTIFPNTPASVFWSASISAGNSDIAWGVYFANGYDYSSFKTDAFQVRLVRGGQPIGLLVSLSGLGLACPSAISAGASGTCSATASYSDASSKAVNVAWSSSDPAAAVVSAGGVVYAGSVTADTPVTLTASYTENGVTVTASKVITITAAPAALASVSIAGVASLQGNAKTTFKAGAVYSDGSQRTITPAWSVTPASLATITSRGILSVGEVTADTPVTVIASYSEGGITKSVSQTVTVKNGIAALTNLSIIGAQGSLAAGAILALNAEALYGDGSRKPVSATWSVSNATAATITSSGNLTAKQIATNTPVTVSASYTEGGVAKSADYVILVLAAPDTSAGSRIQTEVTTQGTLNNFGLTVIVKVDSATARRFAAAGYQVFVVAVLPAGNIVPVQTGFILDRAKNWGVLSWPVKAFLDNVQDTDEVVIEILSGGIDISQLPGASFWVGWGTNAEEMVAAARYRPVFMVP